MSRADAAALFVSLVGSKDVPLVLLPGLSLVIDELVPMTVQYLVLTIALTVTLNHRNRFVRAAGTLLVAIGLSFIVLSVYLADSDGTFAALPAGSARPKLLNVQAAGALIAIVFLLWATWCQLRRTLTADVPWRNTGATYGLISSGAPLSSSLQRWERFLARAMHPTGYALIILLPLTGLMLTISNGIPLDLYGGVVPLPNATTPATGALWPTLHDLVLPTLFYVFIASHRGAVLKHHFIARRTEDVRRMLR